MLRSMQSFLGSLNYYGRFIEDLAIYASVLYELREADFYEMTRRPKIDGNVKEEGQTEDDNKWTRATAAFTALKKKIANVPILQHFDPSKQPVVVVYASTWAISAALMQEYDGMCKPVTFTSRTLKPNEINYGIVDKEVLSLLRMLDVCYTQLVTRSIKVLTRHSTLAWLVHSSGLEGSLGRWAALLSSWTLEIVKCTKGEDEILGVLVACITPRAEVYAVLTSIAPRKQPRQAITMSPSTMEIDKKLLVLSFDGSARTKRKAGAYSAIVWSLPEWSIISAAFRFEDDLTVNEAEYKGLLLGLELLFDLDRGRLVICGDSNLVIQQMSGEMVCKAPGLILLRQKALEELRSWKDHGFLHMKRDWNQSADRLARAALQREGGVVVADEAEFEDLVTLNRLDEVLVPQAESTMVKITAVTRTRKRRVPEVLQEEVVQKIRMERLLQAQMEEKWISYLKKYLEGDVQELTVTEAKSCTKIAEYYEIDENGLMFYCPPAKTLDEDSDLMARLVVPETLQEDILHHYHTSLEGGHQGIGRTYQRIRAHFQWRGLYQSVQRYVGQCVDCETGKGRLVIRGHSPGNLQATYPFQIIAMDHIPSLPKSYKGNTELLIWVDLFTGFVVVTNGPNDRRELRGNCLQPVWRQRSHSP